MSDFASVPGILAGSVACVGLDSLFGPALAHNIAESRTSFILCAVWSEAPEIVRLRSTVIGFQSVQRCLFPNMLFIYGD
jgi:hypothetical protein